MGDSSEVKQNYLFDEIIEKGYDAEAFMNFMAEAKEDGTNIEVWSLTELMKIVQDYRQNYTLAGEDIRKNQNNNNNDNYSNHADNTTEDYPQNSNYNYADNNTQPAVEETNVQRFERELREQQQAELAQNSLQFTQPILQEQKIDQPSYSVSQQTNQIQMKTDEDPFSAIQAQRNQQAQQKQTTSASTPTTFDSGYQSILPPQTTIPFEQDLGKLKKKEDFDFFEHAQVGGNAGFFNAATQPQTFKNNDIWNIAIPTASTTGTTAVAATTASSNFWNTTTSGHSTNTSVNDPFQMFQTAQPGNTSVSNNNNNSNAKNNDPFSQFFSAPQKQGQSGIANTLPKQGQSTNPQTQTISDSDFDILFTPISNVPKPQQTVTTGKPIQQNQQQQQQQQAIQNKNNGTLGKSQQQSAAGMSLGVAAVGTGIKAAGATTNNTVGVQQKQPASIAQVQQKTNSSDSPQEQEPKRKKSLVLVKEDISYADKFHTEKPCRKGVATVISVKPEVSVTIVEHEVASGSLFSIGGSSIAVYHVKTLPFNWIVKRKYTDFVWLRTLLIKMYPGIPIPPLPGKTMKSLDEKLVSRRKGYFESFLAEVMSFPDLKASKYLTDFLSIQDEKQFKLKVKATEKLIKPKNVSEIETVSGKVGLSKNPECNAHSQNLADYFEQNDTNYEKLKRLSKQLMVGYNEVGNILHQMGETFAALNSNVSAYNAKTQGSFQVRELEETYKIMNNMCVMQANSFSDQIKIFQNHFYNFFKFHKDNLTGLKEIVKTRNELSTVLAKKDSNEGSGLSAIFRSSKETVYNPSKILKELEEQVGYYNEQTLTCSKKIFENRYKTYSLHFKTYCSLQKSIVAEMSAVWQEISEHFSKLLAGEPGRKRIEIIKKIV